MHALTTQMIEDAEQRLQLAMLHSDTLSLSELLSEELLFINHLGQRMSKADDLKMHQSGLLNIHDIELTHRVIQLLSSDSAHVVVDANIQGSFDGTDVSGKFTFSRVWQKKKDSLQILLAQSTLWPT